MTLHVFQSECDWVVAESLDDAFKVMLEHTGETRKDLEEYDADYFEQLADDHKVSIIDDGDLPSAEWTRTTKTCAEWAKSDGRGFLCSTEY